MKALRSERYETVKKNFTISQRLSVGDKLKFVYDKARELANGGLVSKFAVADALKDHVDRTEIFQLLAKLEEEGKLTTKGLEWYVVVAT